MWLQQNQGAVEKTLQILEVALPVAYNDAVEIDARKS